MYYFVNPLNLLKVIGNGKNGTKKGKYSCFTKHEQATGVFLLTNTFLFIKLVLNWNHIQVIGHLFE